MSTTSSREHRIDASDPPIGDGPVIYWHIDDLVMRPSAMASMHERLFPGRPAVRQHDGQPPTPDLVAGASAIFVFADAWSVAARERIEAVLPPGATGAPVIVRTRTVADPAFPAWLAARGAGFVPAEISNQFAAEHCVRAALGPGRWSPPRRQRSFTLFERLGLARRPGNDLDRTLDEIERLADRGRTRVSAGVVSLPRSGSKSLADRLVLWRPPSVPVFHCHDMSPGRVEQLRRADQDAVSAEAAARTAYKHDAFRRMRHAVDSADRLFLFVSERSPASRIRSEFVMKHRDAIAAAAGSSGTAVDALRTAYRDHALREAKRLRGWYTAQFATPFDLDVTRFDRQALDAGVARLTRGRTTLVFLRMERTEALFAPHDPGTDDRPSFSLVSRNSGAEMGYGDAYAWFTTNFPFPDEAAERLADIPEVRHLHG